MTIIDDYTYSKHMENIMQTQESPGRELVHWEPNGNMHLLCCERAETRSIVKFVGCDGLQIHVSASFNKVQRWMLKRLLGLEVKDYVVEEVRNVNK